MHYLLGLMLLATSCASFQRDEQRVVPSGTESDAIRGELKKICWTSEGKGRVEKGEERYLFHYESLLSIPEQTWSMAIEVPMRGEETFSLSWKKNLVVRGIAPGQAPQELLDALGIMLKLASAPEKIQCDHSLRCRQDQTDLQSSLTQKTFSIGHRSVQLTASEFQEGHYSRIRLENKEGAKAVLELFVESCE